MLTIFGKYLQKIRLDFNETIDDMAEKLNSNVEFLSQIENGKSNIPCDWASLLADVYRCDINYVQSLIDQSQIDLLIDLQMYQDNDRQLLVAMFRCFTQLNCFEKNALKALIYHYDHSVDMNRH